MNEKVTALQWATISNGKIVQLADGFPAHELNDCQIILSDEEFNLLRTASLEKVERLVKQIKAKIKANGS